MSSNSKYQKRFPEYRPCFCSSKQNAVSINLRVLDDYVSYVAKWSRNITYAAGYCTYVVQDPMAFLGYNRFSRLYVCNSINNALLKISHHKVSVNPSGILGNRVLKHL